MKQNKNFAIQPIVGLWFLFPVGEATKNGANMLQLNAVGSFLWQELESDKTEEQLVAALKAKYEVSTERAREDVSTFLDKLRKNGCIED